MANTTEATYSFTTKIGNDLLTVRGDTIDEFAMNLASLHDHVEVIELITTIQLKLKPGTVADIQKAFNGTVIPDPLAAKPTPPAPVRPAGFSPAPTNAPTGVVPMCEHGPMRFVKGGISKTTGKGYPAFYSCSMPKGQTQCKSVNA